ncbi:hypothetical protein [Burkholderia sp. Ac-20353]|uniref:hypothetical protein n=1 Tax=Burkholderia sp. Ac-20353 TaxID=2703894 RepID=UPI00197B490E|nr:hypothetical protein [Burkholderia sp. Ac-20353]MBN3786774.1 hypothetical protein [Burkholderia sp. Ac-20353]
MNALRHFLLRGGVAKQLLWGLILVVSLSRALMSGAVMLDPDAPDSGTVVLCSGHGPLVLGVTALMAGFESRSSVAPANDVLALADALTHGTPHDGKPMSSDHGAGICAFSAALFAALTPLVLFFLLFRAAVARRLRIPPVCCSVARSALDDLPPSRAPPLFA